MTTEELYKKYRVIPNLQDHLYRVAGVGWIIADAYGSRVNKNDIIKACLLHDIANIIKFDLMRHPGTLQPQGFEYWNNVRNEMIAKYGDNENEAHYAIARELNIEKRIIDLMKVVGFPNSCEVQKSDDLEKMITAYADRRVDFNGITSVADRDENGRQRYGYEVSDFSIKMNRCCNEMEEVLFNNISLKPEEINDRSVNVLRSELESYVI